jgi:hypothetical protein
MVTWAEFRAAAPALAAAVEARFVGRRHHVMATVRADGSPRLSGTEVDWSGGAPRLGMMPGTVRAADLRRDPRVAVHSQGVDPPEGNDAGWPGEAKLAGRAVWVDHGGEVPADVVDIDVTDIDVVDIDVTEVVLTVLGTPPDHLVVEWWTPAGGVRRVERR